MDKNRLQWITTRPPTLDAFSINVRLAETPTGTLATLWGSGTCDRKRGTLWTYQETIGLDADRYSCHDLISHLVLVALQDRPTTEQALTRGLLGSAWEQPELPF